MATKYRKSPFSPRTSPNRNTRRLWDRLGSKVSSISERWCLSTIELISAMAQTPLPRPDDNQRGGRCKVGIDGDVVASSSSSHIPEQGLSSSPCTTQATLIPSSKESERGGSKGERGKGRGEVGVQDVNYIQICDLNAAAI